MLEERFRDVRTGYRLSHTLILAFTARELSHYAPGHAHRIKMLGTATTAKPQELRYQSAKRPMDMDSPRYFTPDINFTVGLISTARSTAAPNETRATVPNSVGSGIDSYTDAATPAR